jgi:hypothetical protein
MELCTTHGMQVRADASVSKCLEGKPNTALRLPAIKRPRMQNTVCMYSNLYPIRWRALEIHFAPEAGSF